MASAQTGDKQTALLVEYEKRFEYEFASMDRRWQMMAFFLAISGGSLALYQTIHFRVTLALFNILTGLFTIAYYVQVRSRAYDNAIRLKEISDMLGIVGVAHIRKRERLFRFSGVSFYAILFMILLVVGWTVILVGAIFGLNIP